MLMYLHHPLCYVNGRIFAMQGHGYLLNYNAFYSIALHFSNYLLTFS